jgi:hypothetical protein
MFCNQITPGSHACWVAGTARQITRLLGVHLRIVTTFHTCVHGIESYRTTAPKDLGPSVKLETIPWAAKQIWAPDAAQDAAGGFHVFFPARDSRGWWRIGVAHANTPSGPFIADPEPLKGIIGIDPCIFVDDNGGGTAWLFVGGMWDGGLELWMPPLVGTLGDGEQPVAQPEGTGVPQPDAPISPDTSHLHAAGNKLFRNDSTSTVRLPADLIPTVRQRTLAWYQTHTVTHALTMSTDCASTPSDNLSTKSTNFEKYSKCKANKACTWVDADKACTLASTVLTGCAATSGQGQHSKCSTNPAGCKWIAVSKTCESIPINPKVLARGPLVAPLSVDMHSLAGSAREVLILDATGP